jgi:hypothetical protein
MYAGWTMSGRKNMAWPPDYLPISSIHVYGTLLHVALLSGWQGRICKCTALSQIIIRIRSEMVDRVQDTDTVQENVTDPMQFTLFRVMRRKQPVVSFCMALNGAYAPAVPEGKSIEVVWPHYAAVASYLGAWFADMADRELVDVGGRVVMPGDHAYPRALAAALGKSALLGLWAYVTPTAVWVSFRQIALGLGRQPALPLRYELESRGIQFVTDHGHYLASMQQVAARLGELTADRILLYPHQVADYLGVVPKVATRIMRRFGLAISRNDMTVVSWGRLRRLHRVGPRSFELSNDSIND